MQNLNIGFIGGGNMAEALIAGLTAAGHAAERVRVTDISKARLDVLQGQYGINVCADIAEVAAASDVLLLAVIQPR